MKKKIAIIVIAAAVVIAAVIGITTAGGGKKSGSKADTVSEKIEKADAEKDAKFDASAVSKGYGGPGSNDPVYDSTSPSIPTNVTVPGEIGFGNCTVNLFSDYGVAYYYGQITSERTVYTNNGKMITFYTISNGIANLDVAYLDDIASNNPQIIYYTVTGTACLFGNEDINTCGYTTVNDVEGYFGQASNYIGDNVCCCTLTYGSKYGRTPITIDYGFNADILGSITVHNAALENQYSAYLY